MPLKSEPIRVLIVDDSAVIRSTFREILNGDPQIEVIGVAPDPLIASRYIQQYDPDVLTLDIEMPRMDGLTFLRKLMAQRPLPVVICSSLTEKGSQISLKALETGAVEALLKPKLTTTQERDEFRIRLRDVVKAAAITKVGRRRTFVPHPVEPKLNADAILPPPNLKTAVPRTHPVIAIGASTGGTEAIREFLAQIPPTIPPMVMVQHMPAGFTKTFAERLNAVSPIHVKEAAHGDLLKPGWAYLAPGDRHLVLRRAGTGYSLQVVEGPLVSRHRPSVDVLFRSTARSAGPNAIGIIMTGMGDDGAQGMLEMHQSGAWNLAQDESSCVVFGMPREAIKAGGVDVVAALSDLPRHVLQGIRR